MAHTKETRKRAYEKIKTRRAEFLKGKKCPCGSEEKLNIHHINPSEKVDHKVWSWKKERMDAELAKCTVLCEKCHVELHAKERRDGDIHGSVSSYSKHGCRCSKCRETAVSRIQKWRLKRFGSLSSKNRVIK